MKEGKPILDRPVLVEGKYDKIKLQSLFEGTVMTTGGFSVFHRKEQLAMLRRLADEKGLIVLTDSDGGGKQIRGFLRGVLPPTKVIHLYIPTVEGKEKRKDRASKAGLLGVEGMTPDVLYRLLAPYTSESVDAPPTGERLTKARLYADGFSGTASAVQAREVLLEALDLPKDLSANALIETVNLLGGMPVYLEALQKVSWCG